MIQQIFNILNKAYNGKITFRMRNGDYDFYYNSKYTNVSLTDGDKGDLYYIVKLIKTEIDFFLQTNIEKINTEEKHGIKKFSVRGGNRRRRKHR